MNAPDAYPVAVSTIAVAMSIYLAIGLAAAAGNAFVVRRAIEAQGKALAGESATDHAQRAVATAEIRHALHSVPARTGEDGALLVVSVLLVLLWPLVPVLIAAGRKS